MSLDLSHGFLAEAQFDAGVPDRVFAANFLRRTGGALRIGVPEGRELAMWFDRPRATLVRDPDPAGARVEASIGITARLSDRFDEARLFVTARGRITDRTVETAEGTRACPSVDLGAPEAEFALTSSNNAEYDAVVLETMTRLLREESPFALGPLASSAGKRFYRTYFGFPDRPEGLLAMFVAALGDPPTPGAIPSRLHPQNDVVLLVPDDLVNRGIQQGLEEAGLATMPAQLNPDVKVRSLDVSLRDGHVLIAGAGTKTTDVLGFPVGTDFTFKAFVQLLVAPDGSVDVHVVSTQQDLDDTLGAFADFISAGALTRLMERMVPAAIGGLSLGAFEGLRFFSSSVPSAGDSAPAAIGSIITTFANGLGVRFEVDADVPAPIEPPFIRGHVTSREFHVKGCAFGDLITAKNLSRFPSRESAIRAGYDGCATCQPEFSVASFGDLSVEVAHPPDAHPGTPVVVTATYADALVRFGVTLAPAPETKTHGNPVDLDGVPTHRVSFSRIVPATWTVSATCGDWSAEANIPVGRRFVDAAGQLQGEVTKVRATVGQPGLEQVTA